MLSGESGVPISLLIRSFGTAACGTLPGSVKVVFAWQASAITHKITYTHASNFGMPPVLARAVNVNALYANKIHTIHAIIVPA